jgi:hypothetical protein
MNSYVMQGMAAGLGQDLRRQANTALWARLARRARRVGTGHSAEI